MSSVPYLPTPLGVGLVSLVQRHLHLAACRSLVQAQSVVVIWYFEQSTWQYRLGRYTKLKQPTAQVWCIVVLVFVVLVCGSLFAMCI